MRNIFLFTGCFLLLNCHAQTIKDIDGNIYNTVIIGRQVWMKENLKTTKYRNGVTIPNLKDPTRFAGYCDYNHDPSISEIYGRLYDGATATDTNKICPFGWHVPSDGEWNILAKFLDSNVDTTATGKVGKDAGGKMKETGKIHWKKTNKGATNISGFTGLPGGWRTNDGVFEHLGTSGFWLSATIEDLSYIYCRVLDDKESKLSRFNESSVASYSVRCLKD